MNPKEQELWIAIQTASEAMPVIYHKARELYKDDDQLFIVITEALEIQRRLLELKGRLECLETTES